MENSSSFFTQDDVEIHFVIPDDRTEDNISSQMTRAYELSKSMTTIKFVKDSDCLKLKKHHLTRKNVYVFEKFEGDSFKHLTSSKAMVIGPRCLISCITNDDAIPSASHPVFNVAMKNLIVSMSGFNGLIKTEISRLVKYMGGTYYENLNGATTHLVSNTVQSEKYEMACDRKLKIMHVDWVKTAWERSQVEDFHASDEEFDRFKLPIFFNLTFSSTGLIQSTRLSLQKDIVANGGKFMGAFKSEEVNILILNENKKDSDKFRAAYKCKKECLTPEWVFDSVKVGYALPLAEYSVVADLKGSTPKKNMLMTSQDFNADNTALSEISHIHSGNTNLTINDSMMSSASVRSTRSGKLSVVKQDDRKFKKALDEITSQIIRKAGSFLDGCNIYLSGFTSDEKEKLNKILNRGGATRYDEINDKISHIIVGDQVTKDLKEVEKQQIFPSIVTFDWLMESLKLGNPLAEEDYKFVINAKDLSSKEAQAPSPATKKNLESMNSTFKRPAVPPKFNLDQPELKSLPSVKSTQSDEVLNQYLVENDSLKMPEDPKASSTRIDKKTPPKNNTESSEYTDNPGTETQVDFLVGKTVFIFGFDKETGDALLKTVENAGGTMVDEKYQDIIDYIVLPSIVDEEVNVKVNGRYTVSDYWIEDSDIENKCMPIMYYHKPTVCPSELHTLLEGDTIVLSTYANNERTYVEELASFMGATANNRLVKKERPVIISPVASGSKYDFAIKWNLSVVTSAWLLECLQQKRRVDETPYLVGEAKPSDKNIIEPPVEPVETNNFEFAKPIDPSDVQKAPNLFSDIEDPWEGPSKLACMPCQSTDDLTLDRNETESQKENQDQEDSPLIIKNRRLMMLAKKRTESTVTSPLGLPRLLKHTSSPLPETPSSNLSTPITPAWSTPEIIENPLSITDKVMEFDTPLRDTLYKVLKEQKETRENMTPRTKIRQELMQTPSNTGSDGFPSPVERPDCMKPGAMHPKMRAYMDTPTPEHLKNKRRSEMSEEYTPFSKREKKEKTPTLSEVKRRFWRHHFSEDYMNMIQAQCSNTQFDPISSKRPADTENDDDELDPNDSSIDEVPCSNQVAENEEDEPDAMKRMRDMINKNREERKSRTLAPETQYVPRNDVPRFDSEGFDVLSEDCVVGWREDDNKSPRKRSISRHIGQKVFAMSNIEGSEREDLERKIINLGGTISGNGTNSKVFDMNCTHILTNKMNRGEKTMAGIASGKWILSEKYIYDSYQEKKFLSEEFYEWGNPKFKEWQILSEKNGKGMSCASYKWRIKLSQDDQIKGAFSNYKVLLLCNEEKPERRDPFVRLLTAGGAEIVDCEPPYEHSDAALSATHCIIERKKVKLAREDHKALAEAGVKVLDLNFISDFLTSENPDLKAHEIPYN